MFETIRKKIVFWMGIAFFLGIVWAIKKYGIWDFFESLFTDPLSQVPSVDINKN